MAILDDISKTFAFKPDIWQFLNSPLFFLIVIMVVVAFVVGWAVIKRRRNRKDTKKKLRFRKKDKEKEEPDEESSDGGEPVAHEPEKQKMVIEGGRRETSEQPIYEKIGPNESLILSKDKDGVVTIISNVGGYPEVKKLSTTGKEEKEDETLDSFWDTHGKSERKEIIKIMATEMKLDPDVFIHELNWDKLPRSQRALLMKYEKLIRKEYNGSQDRDLTTQRRKPEYHPYIPETERAIPLEKPKDYGMVKKVLRYSSDDVGDVERQVDELLVKKKRNFLSRMEIPRWERTMKIKKKEEDTASEQITETTDAKRQLTEKEVFEDDEVKDEDEKGLTVDQAIDTGILEKEPANEPQKEEIQPTQQNGESKRQIVLKLLDQGKSKDDILKQTGYDEKTVLRYLKDWTDAQFAITRKLIADGRWGIVKKIVDILDKRETFLVEDGKLYYPGRDKMTYVFLATTITLVCIAITEGYFLWLS